MTNSTFKIINYERKMVNSSKFIFSLISSGSLLVNTVSYDESNDGFNILANTTTFVDATLTEKIGLLL
jgi:hypothetical protein